MNAKNNEKPPPENKLLEFANETKKKEEKNIGVCITFISLFTDILVVLFSALDSAYFERNVRDAS